MKKIINCLAVLLISLNSLAQEADLFRKDGHKGELVSVSISPDNKYIISVESDTLAIIWDITTGQQIRTIKNVESAAFRDNNSIYLAMNDKTFKLVDLVGQTISVFGSKGYKYNFSNFCCYDDIKKVFFPETGLYLFGTDVFDMDKGFQRRLEIGSSGNTHTDFYPVTRQLAVADRETGKITLIDVGSGNPVSTIQTNNLKGEYMRVKFSPNGKKLLVTRSSVFLVIDIDSRTIQRTIKSPKSRVWTGVFSPDGETLALNDEINGIERLTMLDIESGKTLFVKNFKGFMFPVEMKFSPDGGHLAFWVQEYDDTESLYLLDAKKGTTNWRYSQDHLSTASYGSSMLFSANGQKLLFGNAKNLLWVNTSTGLIERNFAQTLQGRISQLYFIKDNSRMISHTRDYFFSWNLQTGEMERVLFSKDRKAGYMEKEYMPAPDGTKYFVLEKDNFIEIDTSGRKTFQFTSTKKLESRFNVATSFDGQFVLNQGYPLTGGCTTNKNANTLEVYDSKTHKLVYSNPCVTGTAAFFKTQNILVCQEKSDAHPLRFYQMPSGKLLYEIKPPNTLSAEKPILSENDRYLTAGVYNEPDGKTIKLLIDLTTKEIRSIPVTNPNALRYGNTKAELKAIGITKGEKYIVYDVNSTRRIMFYNIEEERFDDEVTFNYPADISIYSAIALSPNGKFLVLGTFAGSIMLWDIEKKKFQGTLYPDASQRNWAVVSPQGQFDGNAGAQNSMFHVSGNTVVPLNSMFEKFWTPRLLPRILEGEQFGPSTVDVKKLKKAPVVKIQFKENTRNLEVDDDVAIQTIETKFGNASVAISAECPLDAVTEIRLYQNGKLVETTRNLTVEDEKQGDKTLAKTFQVNLLEGTNRFRAIAFNSERTESRPVELNVVFKREKTAPAAGTIVPGIQLHVVVVGINIYKNPKYNLNYAEADAQAFKGAIENGSTGIFSKVNTYYIKDDKASKAGIIAELDKVKATSKPEDVFIFYYAGHGVVNDKKEFFLVPYDVTQLYGNDDALGQKGLSSASLQQFSKDIKAQKQLYILDACQSAGALEDIVASRGAAEEKAIAQLARSTGTHWLTASGSNQFAAEFTKLGHGAFTYCLLEAFKGITDNGDKKITVKELDAYLQNKVPEITQKYQGAAQYPASYGYGNDFPLILLK